MFSIVTILIYFIVPNIFRSRQIGGYLIAIDLCCTAIRRKQCWPPWLPAKLVAEHELRMGPVWISKFWISLKYILQWQSDCDFTHLALIPHCYQLDQHFWIPFNFPILWKHCGCLQEKPVNSRPVSWSWRGFQIESFFWNLSTQSRRSRLILCI